MDYDLDIVNKVSNTLVIAGSSFSDDKKEAYKKAIEREKNDQARWVLQNLLENADVAEANRSPLCDDTGIPHVVIEAGPDISVSGTVINSIQEGIRQGLRRLPGRPMAVKGDDLQRIAQSEGMYDDPGMLDTAPILIRSTPEKILRVYVLLFGGGPAIRAHTSRVFHRHQTEAVIDQIVEWAKDSTAQLGCTPCTLAIGVGRSHYEATALMLEAMIDGKYDVQSGMEQEITEKVNSAEIGPLGLGGETTVLATFMKVGPQRSSGVRIVSMRPCCCFEPRIASCVL